MDVLFEKPKGKYKYEKIIIIINQKEGGKSEKRTFFDDT